MSVKYTLELQTTGYELQWKKYGKGKRKNKKGLTYKFFFNVFAWI